MKKALIAGVALAALTVTGAQAAGVYFGIGAGPYGYYDDGYYYGHPYGYYDHNNYYWRHHYWRHRYYDRDWDDAD